MIKGLNFSAKGGLYCPRKAMGSPESFLTHGDEKVNMMKGAL